MLTFLHNHPSCRWYFKSYNAMCSFARFLPSEYWTHFVHSSGFVIGCLEYVLSDGRVRHLYRVRVDGKIVVLNDFNKLLTLNSNYHVITF